jgi:hypothetical protein
MRTPKDLLTDLLSFNFYTDLIYSLYEILFIVGAWRAIL